MKKPTSPLKDTLLANKTALPPTDKDFEAAADRVASVYPAEPAQAISRLTVEIPTELLKKIRIHCAKSGEKMKQYVVKVLQDAQEKKGH